MKNIKSILIVVQRSNGDVFLANTLIFYLHKFFPTAQIDLLINDDTIAIAKLLPNIRNIYKFSYSLKKSNPIKQEISILKKIFKKYDLGISLTASDRSVLYSVLSSKYSISAVDKDTKKSWWKKILLKNSYVFDSKKHIIENNLTPLNFLNISYSKKMIGIDVGINIFDKVKNIVKNIGSDKFIIFHPSAQYSYKTYPEKLRNQLLLLLANYEIKVIVTGGSSSIDLIIKDSIPRHENIYNLINETSLEEYIALSKISLAYVGMDTLNMHIASSQNKRVFAIFGPTNLRMWSPWSNITSSCAFKNQSINNYGNITIFQADLPCVACGRAGCNDQHDESLCLNYIAPELIYQKVKDFIDDQKI